MPITDPQWLLQKLLLLPPLLLSLVLHEYAHARTALAFGDDTARNAGRITLNPLAHLDPIGTIAIVLIGFGWAKPVPVNPANLHPRRLGDTMVSLAGPLTNLSLALLAGIVLRILLQTETVDLWMLLRASFNGTLPSRSIVDMFGFMLLMTMIVNVALCVFNLVPLFPLDGHHIVREQLPIDRHRPFMEWQLKYGRPMLMTLILVPMLLPQFNPIGWVLAHVNTYTLQILMYGL